MAGTLYEKRVWVNNVTKLNDSNMNHIENGIEAATVEINTLNRDLAKLDNELYLYTEEAISSRYADVHYSITADGLKVAKQNYTISKYEVTEGDLLYLHLSKDDADGAVYQFMKSKSVSYSSKENIVGATVTEALMVMLLSQVKQHT